jgi:hypothetical protein
MATPTETPTMQLSDHFGTSKFKESDLEQVVERIHLCGYMNEDNVGDDDGRPPTNHWAIFLQVDPKKSVKLDMIPGDGDDGLLGYIVLESKGYNMTNKGIRSLTFIPTCEFPVSDVLNLIMKNGRDKYIFTEEEEGCRFWICTLVRDLEEAGKLLKDSAATALSTLGSYWVFPSGSVPRKMEAGTFF